MDGWTPERALLTALVDAVRQLTAITIAVNSENGKVPDFPQLPRPVTGIERAREQAEERRREQAKNALLAKLLPHLHSV